MGAIRRSIGAGLLVALHLGAGPAFANGCGDDPQPEGVSLAELEAKHAAALAETDGATLLANAKRLYEIEIQQQPHGLEENRVLALLQLDRLLAGSYGPRAKGNAVILASQIRAAIANDHQPPHYRCHELKAHHEYIEAQGDAYAFAELWGTYLYDAQSFLDRHAQALPRDEAMRVRFAVHRAIDPCNPYRANNGCYGPFFSAFAEQAAGTPVHRRAMEYAFEANLNLAACPQATAEERAIGAEAARRWAAELGHEAGRSLAALEAGTFEAKPLSDMCRTFGDT